MTARNFLAFAFVLFFAASSWGQSSGNAQVTGLVTDSSGASIADAQVQMTQTDTGLVRTTQTNASGSYTIPELPTGSYQLQVKKEGFSPYTQLGIVLEVGSNPTLNVSLQLGALTQEVTVTANAALVETHSTTLGEVVTQEEVLDIPLNARDPMQLLLLTPAAVIGSATQQQLVFPNPYTITFQGTAPGDGNYYLDGGNDNDYITNGSYPLPFPDALQEFNVVTSAVPAQYGIHSSATVNAITKSGTNGFHGDAFEFVRNGLFNARQYYAPFRDPLKRNQYGGVLGGPIRKDKLFFFAALQRTTVRDQNNLTAVLPTNAVEAGDFTNATSAACNNGKPVTLKGPFTGGAKTISPTLFSSPSVNLTKLIPVPTDQICGNYPYQVKVVADNLQVIGKVDWHINEKHSLFVRYYKANFTAPPQNMNFLTLNQLSQIDRYQSVTLGDTYVISPTVVNSFRANVNRSSNFKGETGWVTPTDLGVQDFYNPVPKFIAVSVGSNFSVGGTGLVPAFISPTDYNISDDLEITRGSHQLQFGGDFVHFNYNEIYAPQSNGSFSFSGATTGLPVADFMLGDIATFQQANTYGQHPRKKAIGVYAQDSWQMNRKLTFNYGLRWEPYIAPNEASGHGNFFSIANFTAGIRSKVYPTAPAGEMFPSVGGVSTPGDYTGYGTDYLSTWSHFEPRIGFSYDPRGKGREVFRASYGTFYDFELAQLTLSLIDGPPWGDSLSLNGNNFSNPYANYTNSFTGKKGNPFPITTIEFPTAAIYASFFELQNKAPMLQQWNASFQKQFGSSWSITATYVGNHGTHIILVGDENPGTYIAPGNCGLPSPTTPCSTTSNTQSRRRLTLLNAAEGASYGQIVTFGDFGWERYEAGILTLQKRLSNNFNLTANYTYGHCIDNGEGGASSFAAYLPPENLAKGNCTWDHRHQLTINGALHSPNFHSGVLEAIAGHWEITPIVSYLSGDWLSLGTGTDVALTGDSNGTQLLNIIGNPATAHTPIVGGTLGVHWFNPNAFAVPTIPTGFTGNVVNQGFGPVTIGPIGNLGARTLNGPSNTDFDLALVREFKIKERSTIQARVEAFNVFNWVRYYDPTTAFNSSNFGNSIAPGSSNSSPGFSSPQDPRIMQFALKYVF